MRFLIRRNDKTVWLLCVDSDFVQSNKKINNKSAQSAKSA